MASFRRRRPWLHAGALPSMVSVEIEGSRLNGDGAKQPRHYMAASGRMPLAMTIEIGGQALMLFGRETQAQFGASPQDIVR